MQVLDINGDILVVSRGQEGTTARDHYDILRYLYTNQTIILSQLQSLVELEQDISIITMQRLRLLLSYLIIY